MCMFKEKSRIYMCNPGENKRDLCYFALYRKVESERNLERLRLLFQTLGISGADSMISLCRAYLLVNRTW